MKAPSVYVPDFVIHPHDNMIVIATQGRGMFTLDADNIKKIDKPVN